MRSKASSKASRLSDKMRAKKPDLFIDGDGIYLRHLMEKDLKGRWYDWLNDSVVTRYQNKGIFPNTLQKQRKYFESLQGSSGEVVLAIVEKRTEKHIGNVGLHEIEWVHRHATLGIVIGERDFWGKGYGKQAWRLITEYGMNVLNLHRITAFVIAENKSSLGVAASCGYVKEGVMKNYYFKNGRYHDLVVMGRLAGS